MANDDLNLDNLTDREILVLLARTVPGRLNDHGRRLRALETFRNVLAGGGTVLAAIGAALKLSISVKTGQ